MTASGVAHREGGPSVIWSDGRVEWWQHGKLHRLDGPAVFINGGFHGWYINGEPVTEQIHQWAKEFNIDLKNLTDEDKQMIVLYWADYGKS